MGIEKRRTTPAQRPTANPRPRNIYYVESRKNLRHIFHRETLVLELERRGLNHTKAAQRGGVNRTVLLRWLHGETVPNHGPFERFLDNLRIDKGPWKEFLEAQGPVTFVCPQCGKRRLCARGELRGRKLKRRANGDYELRCWACARRIRGFALKPYNDRRLEKRLGKAKASDLIEWAKDGDQEAQKEILRVKNEWRTKETPEHKAQRLERLRTARRQPRTESYRLACSVGGTVTRARRLKRPLHLCRLCHLVIHVQEWHRPCWDTYRVWHQRQHGRLPPPGDRPRPLPTDGPNPETNLNRNYGLLIAKRGRKERTSFQQLLHLETPKLKSRNTVAEGIKDFIRRLPGSWDFVFTGEVSTGRANRGRQRLVPLPFEIKPIVERGERDRLIRDLLTYGMTEDTIARLTGASLPRVRGIHADLGARLAASA